MTERNGANWCFWKDTEAEKAGEGVERRVLAFCDELMCVENTFEKGGIGAMHHHPHTQITYVASGRFRFTIGDEVKEVGPGDTLCKQNDIVHGCECLEAGVLVDFFTPIVDEPYMFGQIAAANALSDVYAMGGVPKLALNVVAFPNCLGPEVLEEILRGGADKVMEAGAVLAGGHTINDKEPKYGLCVTGFVHPDKMWKNYGAEAGDILILTKPLGCGILNTAIKAEMASREEIERVQKVMAKLNKYAAEIALKYTIHSCTDVTGFSLAGHSLEMAKGSHKTLVIQTENLPIIKGVEEYAQMGLIPEGAYRNRDFAGSEVRSEIKELWMEDLVFDPQTSGGLLLAVPPEEADALAKELSGMDIFGGIIGYVTEPQDKAVIFE